jgi:predicted nucleic acid-binding protein
MIAYPDTSFFCSLYREQVHSERADAYRVTMTEPLHFTRLLEFEFLQAIELQVWLHATDRKKGYARRKADQMLEDWETDIASGLNKVVPYDSDAVFRLAGSYSKNRTTQGGHRSLDILHVATAIHLGAKEFLTFDERQRMLAHHAGLKIPL